MSVARVRAHAAWELRLLMRNGEQILLMFVIPLALLVALRLADRASLNELVPTVLAVSIMATCFTSLAIGTGFERRSGALRFAATTPLTRLDLLLGKFAATAALTLISLVVVCAAGLLLGWQPSADWVGAILIAFLGGAAFSSLAIFLAGAMRAEAVLAVANGLFILLMVFGGVVIPAADMPVTVGSVIQLLPSAALADGLRLALAGGSVPWVPAAILAVWSVVGAVLARRTFRWD